MNSRLLRQLLTASLIAFHAAISLCGPSLHEVFGACHESGLGSPGQSSRPKANHDSTDDCLVCQLLAQGQLPVVVVDQLPAPQAGSWLTIALAPSTAVRLSLTSRQRAPPTA